MPHGHSNLVPRWDEDRISRRSMPGQGESLPERRRNAVLCDFDGTITVQDTAEWILDKHATGDWRALDDCYVRGKISLLDCMREQFSLVRTERSAILEELDRDIEVREGFPEMVALCQRYGVKVQVVSAGLDFVIHHFLNRLGVDGSVSVYSARSFEDDGHISFVFPPLVVPGSKTFKDDLVLQNRRNGYQVTYLGDGMPDLEACALSDYRFAVKGRKLASELASRGLPFEGFERFLEIIPSLESILDPD